MVATGTRPTECASHTPLLMATPQCTAALSRAQAAAQQAAASLATLEKELQAQEARASGPSQAAALEQQYKQREEAVQSMQAHVQAVAAQVEEAAGAEAACKRRAEDLVLRVGDVEAQVDRARAQAAGAAERAAQLRGELAAAEAARKELTVQESEEEGAQQELQQGLQHAGAATGGARGADSHAGPGPCGSGRDEGGGAREGGMEVEVGAAARTGASTASHAPGASAAGSGAAPTPSRSNMLRAPVPGGQLQGEVGGQEQQEQGMGSSAKGQSGKNWAEAHGNMASSRGRLGRRRRAVMGTSSESEREVEAQGEGGCDKGDTSHHHEVVRATDRSAASGKKGGGGQGTSKGQGKAKRAPANKRAKARRQQDSEEADEEGQGMGPRREGADGEAAAAQAEAAAAQVAEEARTEALRMALYGDAALLLELAGVSQDGGQVQGQGRERGRGRGEQARGRAAAAGDGTVRAVRAWVTAAGCDQEEGEHGEDGGRYDIGGVESEGVREGAGMPQALAQALAWVEAEGRGVQEAGQQLEALRRSINASALEVRAWLLVSWPVGLYGWYIHLMPCSQHACVSHHTALLALYIPYPTSTTAPYSAIPRLTLPTCTAYCTPACDT